jgi:DivIVA domain-containing protein
MATGAGEQADQASAQDPTSVPEAQRVSEPRSYVPDEVRDVSFPFSVRGYDRGAVDAYVNRVNRVIAELQVSASPRAAVRHALEQAGQQVSGLLDRARQTAEEITASGRQEADEILARAKAEAAEIVVNASAEADAAQATAAKFVADARAEADEIRTRANEQAEQTLAAAEVDAETKRRHLEEELAQRRAEAEERLQALSKDTNAVLEGRAEIIQDVQALAATLTEMATVAARFQPPGVEEASEEFVDAQGGAELPTGSGRIAEHEGEDPPA